MKTGGEAPAVIAVITPMLVSFERLLRARNRSPRTIQRYGESLASRASRPAREEAS
jgi:hypothetical protein